MPRLISAFIVLLGLLPTVSAAADRPVVIELFTSQGCSSCPPADRFLQELADRDDVIPLALHVDYWDYIGWRDIFAQHKFTKRQKHYARAMDEQVIYTPQMVVNGRAHIVGSDRSSVEQLITAEKSRETAADLMAERQNGVVTIRAERLSGELGTMDVHLIHYTPKQNVSISRGENAGRTFTYSSIVREWQKVGQWNGRAAMVLEAPSASDLPAVAILQVTGNGAIVAAVRVQ